MPSRDRAIERCVGDVGVFGREYWGRQPLLRRGPESYDDLLDVETIEAQLVQLGRRPTFRVVQAGSTIPVADYTKRARVGGVEIDDVADVERVLDLVAGGATVVLQGLHRTWAPLATFCQELELTASHRAQANAYLSPPNAAGLISHADRHDVIVLQVAGVKHWDVEGLGDLELEAGHSMYVPAGTRHSARTTGDHSLHLTIGFLTTTRRRVVRDIIDHIGADLDAPLPFGYANSGQWETLVAEFAAMIDIASRQLAATSPAEEAARQLTRHGRRRHHHVGRLAATVGARVVHDGVRLRWRGAMRRAGIGDDGRVVVELGDRILRVPGAAAEALAVVEARSEFAVADLAGLDEASRATLARRLVREGLLEIADGPAPVRG